MIAIDNVLISDDVVDVSFVCDLNSCKGVCCVEGEQGAPLTDKEVEIIENQYHLFEPYLTAEGKNEISKQGKVVPNIKGNPSTPLVNSKACVYAFWDEKGIVKCGIEKAHEEGKLAFKKPISCHLYPIRVEEYEHFTAVNYFKWSICSAACKLGAKLQVPVYKFLKEPLIRRFGQTFYDELEYAAQHHAKKNK